MSIDLSLAQCLVVADRSGPQVVARSDGFPFAWEETALQLAARFGTRSADVAVPSALFVRPIETSHLAVVQVADVPNSCDLAFRFLFLNRPLYEAIGDPFAIADTFPPDLFARGSLPVVEWIPEPLPRRRVEAIAQLLKDGDGPLLLGATQAILDGGRLLLVRPQPDTSVVRSVWQLLPDYARTEFHPCTFAFAPDLACHTMVLPAEPTPRDRAYLTEEQAKSYPEGKYEFSLQVAVESNNQAELDRLFARKSSRSVLLFALILLGIATAAAVVSKFVF